MVAMEAEIWQWLPEDLLCVILARLPMRVLAKMRTVCKEWNYLLSSRDALQVNVPNWSLHSTGGFLFQVQWNLKDDAEYWVMEGRGSHIYKLPLLNHTFVDTCKGIICIYRKGDSSALSLGIPGTSNWRHLPPPPTSIYTFSGLTYDSSTRRCTLLLGHRRQHDNGRIVISIYDSESSTWTQVSTMVPAHIYPLGNGIYSKGKFYWVGITTRRNFRNRLVSFNIADGVWREIPLPQGCTMITRESLGEYYGQVVVVEHNVLGSVRIWKLNELAQVWCHLHNCRLAKRSRSTPFHSIIINSSGLIMAVDRDQMNISIYDWKGKLISSGMRLPGLRTSQRPFLVYKSSFESNNIWWP